MHKSFENQLTDFFKEADTPPPNEEEMEFLKFIHSMKKKRESKFDSKYKKQRKKKNKVARASRKRNRK